MLQVKLIVVGKLKETFHKEEVNEYQKRLSRFVNLSIIEVDEEKIKDGAKKKEEELILKKEGESLLKQIKLDDYVILLDLHGKEIDSIDFAKKLEDIKTNGKSSISFVIGGSLGLSDDVRNRANFKLKLSPMTFTHQMTRIIILEQIYRACKINANETYHK